jgi:MFS superfamily sulfate permease-like transporter
MSMSETEVRKFTSGDVTGAFADGAILFPLLAALSLQTGMDGGMLLATAGAAYIAAGWLYRVPMAVQPLKSVVVAALAIGATAAEVGLSGFIVGICCFALSFCGANRLAALAPRHLVHGLQMALGIMLLTKGTQVGWAVPEDHGKAAFAALAIAVVFFSGRTERPVMGWIAAAGILAGVYFAQNGVGSAGAVEARSEIHLKTILALALPQMVLTLANSVVGTHDAASRYFGAAARRVTPKRLLRSIGIGNIIAAPLGGMPFCHGAGGLTAHVKGGARSWRMNLVIGGTLISLAAISFVLPAPLIPAYPKVLMAALLVATGWFHMRLAEPSWKTPALRGTLAVMGVTAIATQDMLWVLGAGVACEMLRFARRFVTEPEGEA